MSEMSEELEEIEVDEEETEELEEAEEAPPVETPEEAEARVAAEEEARKYGWRPRDDFDLAPSGWVDAKRFMELPSTQNKVLRDEIKSVRNATKETERQWQERMDRLEAANKAAVERTRKQERAAFEAEIERIRAEKRAAAEEQDLARYHQLDAQERGMTPPPAPEQRQQPGLPPDMHIVDEYKAANEWTKNPLIWTEAQQAVDYAMRSGQRLDSAKAQIDYAEGIIRQKYPHMFQAAEAPASRVDTGGLAPSRRTTRGADDLPPEARKIGKEYVEDGIYKNIAEYAKDYWSES